VRSASQRLRGEMENRKKKQGARKKLIGSERGVADGRADAGRGQNSGKRSTRVDSRRALRTAVWIVTEWEEGRGRETLKEKGRELLHTPWPTRSRDTPGKKRRGDGYSEAENFEGSEVRYYRMKEEPQDVTQIPFPLRKKKRWDRRPKGGSGVEKGKFRRWSRAESMGERGRHKKFENVHESTLSKGSGARLGDKRECRGEGGISRKETTRSLKKQ